MAAPPENTGTKDKDEAIRQELGEFEKISVRLQRRMLAATWTIALVTAVYVGVTALLLIIGNKQLQVMQTQLADARKAAADSARVTERQLKIAESQAGSLKGLYESARSSADAARTSAANSDRIARGSEATVKAARDALRLDQRAWIALSTLEGKPVKGENWTIVVAFKNVGKTPATNVVAVVVCEPVVHAGDPNFDYARLAHPPYGFLAPNNSFNVALRVSLFAKSTGITKPVDDEVLNLLENREVTIYVHGHITYDDTVI